MSKYCSKCGRELGFLEDDFDGLCCDCNESLKHIRKSGSTSIDNPVAEKFTTVVNAKKFIGYSLAIILLIISIKSDYFLYGILISVIIASETWFSTLGFEAIAEGLNLLQEIVDTLKDKK